ncbi:MAG: PEP-CTERM sorting domain-containing protein [Sulfuricaulis sp.]
MIHFKKTLICSAVVIAMGNATGYAATTFNNNFTMLDNGGGLVGGTNDVVFTWDGTLNTNSATAVVNATITSNTPFFGVNWQAYDIKIYGPGAYSLSTADTLGGPGCPILGETCAGDGSTYGGPAGTYNVTVNNNQIMANMKFAWNGTEGIDVVDVWQAGSWSTLNPGNPIFKGPGGSYKGPTYDNTSIDWNGDGVAGAGMIDGPFKGFNANFNVNVVPLPATFWLFGSGLIGLVGFMRKNRNR